MAKKIKEKATALVPPPEIERIPPPPKDILDKIGGYLMDGLSLKEACILSDISFGKFQRALEQNEELHNFIEKKAIQFKQKHLKIVQTKTSDKSSQWILEKLRPDEFGSNKKATVPIDVLGKLIEQIQKSDKGLETRNFIENEKGEFEELNPEDVLN